MNLQARIVTHGAEGKDVVGKDLPRQAWPTRPT